MYEIADEKECSVNALRRLAICAAVLFIAAVPAVCAGQAQTAASSTQEIIQFSGWSGPALRVYLLKPAAAAADAPVVFVMHGVKRDADRYFDDWRPLAEKYGFVLVVPEFSAKAFPRAPNYNLGGVVDKNGSVKDRQDWSYSAIEPIFDAVTERFGLSTEEYTLYGHSAGAQFAHRFALFGAGKRARLVISANAGWYTFPDKGAWPYGPDGLSGAVFDPVAALGAPLVILAGEADIDPQHPSLRRTPEASAQGATRFERAQAFYEAGSNLAASLDTAFGWACVTAPGVDHRDARAAPFAIAIMLEARTPEGGPCRRGVPAE